MRPRTDPPIRARRSALVFGLASSRLSGQSARVTELEVARDAVGSAARALNCAVEFGRLTAAEVDARVGPPILLSPELVELWSVATPLRVSLPFAPDTLHLFPPDVIADRNAGYFGESWRSAWLVIGDVAGDPVIADTGQPGTPIMLAIHGMGAWRPATVAPSPTAFVSAIAAWLRVLHRFDGEHLDEDNDLNVKPGFDEALRDELRLVLSDDCVGAPISYIER